MRLLTLLKSKIHHAIVTDADVNYVGSITIDSALLERVDIVPGELVHVWNVTNGKRFETYALAGETGVIVINGAAAHLAKRGDKIIVAAFCQSNEAVVPRQIVVDEHNRYIRDLPPFSAPDG